MSNLLISLVFFILSPEAYAGKKPCGAIDGEIVPCAPPYAYDAPLRCDPSIEIYDITGHLDRFIEFMRQPDVSCAYEYSNFGFDWLTDIVEEESQGPDDCGGSTLQGSCPNVRKITLLPLRADVVVTTEGVASQRLYKDRRAKVRGCFVTRDVFLVQWIGFDRSVQTQPPTRP